MLKSPEESDIENQEPQQEQGEDTVKMPGSSIPERYLWQPKVTRGEDGRLRETSVESPDGETYKINENEHFVIDKGEKGDYEAAIVGADGARRILRESMATKKAKVELQDQEELEKVREDIGLEQESSEEKTPYDRERLNKITKALSEKGALFGRDIELTDEDKKQIEIVCNIVETQVNGAIENDVEWNNFEELLRKLADEGSILNFSREFPPNWLVDGGENAHIHERRNDKDKDKPPVQMIVPSRIYRAYFYKRVAERTREMYVEPSAETLRGRAARHLANDLKSLAHFIREVKK